MDLPTKRWLAVPPPPGTILRFRKSERAIHWAIAAPFLVCFASAIVLVVFYNPQPDRPLRGLFSWIHRLSGLCLGALPLVALARNWRDYRTHMANIREALTWRRDDLKWLALMGPAAVNRRIALPDQGKFNAAEKLNFTMVLVACPLLLVSGVLVWLPGVAFASWILHLALAGLAAPLVIGHIYMATLNPDTRIGLSGMISGFVDRRWAEHHYRRWYRENFEKPLPARAVAPTLQSPLVRCPSCLEAHAARSIDALVGGILDSTPLPCPHCGAELGALSVIVPAQDIEALLQKLTSGAGARTGGGPAENARRSSVARNACADAALPVGIPEVETRGAAIALADGLLTATARADRQVDHRSSWRDR